MAFESGTVAGNIAIWDKIIDFLTTDTTLVGGGEEWQIVWTHASGEAEGVVLRGPGTGGTDEIFVGLIRVDSVDTDANHIQIYGMTGIVDSAITMEDHINVSAQVRIWADASTMKYWIIANGRRFCLVLNMSTVYQAAYAGLFLPYAPPTSYPYPMFIGGTSNIDTTVANWRSASTFHSQFPFSPKIVSAASVGDLPANAWLLDSTGAWLSVTSDQFGDVFIMPTYVDTLDDDEVDRWRLYAAFSVTQNKLGYETIRSRITTSYGGGYAVEQMTLARVSPLTEMFGVLDGAFFCAGVGNAVENIIQIDSVDYVVVQDVFRTSTLDYWAMRLE